LLYLNIFPFIWLNMAKEASIDAVDRKILFELDKNARMPASKPLFLMKSADSAARKGGSIAENVPLKLWYIFFALPGLTNSTSKLAILSQLSLNF